MVTTEELLQGDEVIVTLTHLLTGDRDHVVMHPVMHGLMTEGSTTLRNLCLMVREDQIESTSVDIELLTEVLRTHRRALHMPARESFAPRTRPMHDMFGCSFLPQREIITVLLLFLTVQLTGLGNDIVEVTTGEFTVRIVLGIFLHVHVNRTVGYVGITLVEDLLYKRNLLDDMSRRMRFYGRR